MGKKNSLIYIILKQPRHWSVRITKNIPLHQYCAERPYFVDILMTLFLPRYYFFLYIIHI